MNKELTREEILVLLACKYHFGDDNYSIVRKVIQRIAYMHSQPLANLTYLEYLRKLIIKVSSDRMDVNDWEVQTVNFFREAEHRISWYKTETTFEHRLIDVHISYLTNHYNALTKTYSATDDERKQIEDILGEK